AIAPDLMHQLHAVTSEPRLADARRPQWWSHGAIAGIACEQAAIEGIQRGRLDLRVLAERGQVALRHLPVIEGHRRGRELFHDARLGGQLHAQRAAIFGQITIQQRQRHGQQRHRDGGDDYQSELAAQGGEGAKARVQRRRSRMIHCCTLTATDSNSELTRSPIRRAAGSEISKRMRLPSFRKLMTLPAASASSSPVTISIACPASGRSSDASPPRRVVPMTSTCASIACATELTARTWTARPDRMRPAASVSRFAATAGSPSTAMRNSPAGSASLVHSTYPAKRSTKAAF